MTRFSIGGFVHLYRSLLRFCHGISNAEAAELTYMLNTANLDSCRRRNPDAEYVLTGPVAFYDCLTGWQRRPYRTEVQFYKAMEALALNIDIDAINKQQLMAYMRLWCLMDSAELRFYKAFDMEIDDQRTVYRECVRRLIPRKDEPGVCLMRDWLDLPMA